MPKENLPINLNTEVGMFEWDTLQNDGVLETVALGTCIGVCIYDKPNKKAFLGHFMPLSASSDESFHQMLDTAKSSIENLRKAKVWVGGGSFLEGFEAEVTDTNDLILKNRREILNIISEKGFQQSNMRIQWLDGTGYIDYSIDVNTGEEEIKIVYDEDS